jgi:hypothetical protein
MIPSDVYLNSEPDEEDNGDSEDTSGDLDKEEEGE